MGFKFTVSSWVRSHEIVPHGLEAASAGDALLLKNYVQMSISEKGNSISH